MKTRLLTALGFMTLVVFLRFGGTAVATPAAPHTPHNDNWLYFTNGNAIAPGVVDTPMWDVVDSLFAKYENRPIGEKKRLVGEAVPFGRMGTPEDMAGAAVFLASADADYIVAQTLNVDGGNWMS